MNFSIRAQFGAASAAFICFLLMTGDAQAYLDPSTGSMVISVIVGIFASIGLAMKTYWYKIKKLFRRGDKGQHTSHDRAE